MSMTLVNAEAPNGQVGVRPLIVGEEGLADDVRQDACFGA